MQKGNQKEHGSNRLSVNRCSVASFQPNEKWWRRKWQCRGTPKRPSSWMERLGLVLSGRLEVEKATTDKAGYEELDEQRRGSLSQ